MIKLPNLDDQNYEDIIETARRRVMQYFPEWTNFNPADPGVTVLELFAWLKEMQQYHLNRITNQGVLSCLRLLGMSPEKVEPARVTAVINPVNQINQDNQNNKPSAYFFPEGFPFAADSGDGGETVFETDAPISSGGGDIAAVWIDSGDSPVEISVDGLVYNQGIVMQPFGTNEREGSCFYIGFAGPVTPELKLYFEISDDYPIERNPFGEETRASRDIVWEYGPEFKPAENIADMTRGFSVSGEISFGIDKWESSKPRPEMRELYWLRARLVSRGAEENPKIKSFFKNFANLIQRETFSRVKELTPEKGVLNLGGFLDICGRHVIFRKEEERDGWRLIPEILTERLENGVKIKPGQPKSKFADGCVYRAVSVKNGFNALLSTETNLPGITVEVLKNQNRDGQDGGGYFEEIEIMVEDGGLWYDWKYTEDLHTAGAHDRAFSIDRNSGNIIFGDNENGACPPAGEENILLSVCRVTKGAAGNILPHTLTGFQFNGGGEAGLAVPSNREAAYGGKNPETTEQTLARVSKILSPGERLVTRGDYEKSASLTPGVRILKVRAIEGYDHKTGDTKAPARVTVIVQPYGETERPMPDSRMLDRVKRHLDKRRLLGSRVEVAPPEYIPVSVRADVGVTENDGVEENIRESLSALLSPLSPLEGNAGIGDPVRLSDVISAVSKCSGVTRVIGVTLAAPENAVSIDRAGNVILPGHAIAYLDGLTVNVSFAK